MAFEVTILHSVTIDVTEAMEWYNEKSDSSALALYEEFAACTKELEFDSQHYGYIHGNFRQMMLKRFPYKIVFLIERNKVTIHRFAHIKQDDKDFFKQR